MFRPDRCGKFVSEVRTLEGAVEVARFVWSRDTDQVIGCASWATSPERSWRSDRHLTVTVVYNHLSTGDFIKDTGPSQDIDSVAARVTYRLSSSSRGRSLRERGWAITVEFIRK